MFLLLGLEDHDVHSTIEILLGEEERQKSDDDLPTIDLTVSMYVYHSELCK